MTKEEFADWLEKLKLAWETKNPKAAADLCALKVVYFETPFSKPFKTREEVFNEWASLPQSQKEINVSYEIINVEESFGIAHWSATFTRIPSQEKTRLDGIFKVTLDKNNLCTEFRQWYNSR